MAKKRKRGGSIAQKMESDGGLELLNGRSQMVVSSLYYSQMREGSRDYIVQYLKDYGKKVGAEKIMDYLSNSLMTMVEDEDISTVDTGLLGDIDNFLRERLKKTFPSAEIVRGFSKWKKVAGVK